MGRTAVAASVILSSMLLYSTAPSAQETESSGTLVELKRADLDGAPGMEVITSRGEWKPGQGIARHSHHGLETGYVVQGAMIQFPGKDPISLPTGAPLWNLRDVPHAGFKVVGDTSLILLTVHVVDKGKPISEYVK